jgi:hypothetical protein
MRCAIALLAISPAIYAGSEDFLKTYCGACHQGAKPAGGFAIGRTDQASQYSRAALRVRNMEMPPKGAPAPPLEERESFLKAVTTELHRQACATGPAAGRAPLRRLNRDEYAATMRDLLDMHLDIGKFLPADGAGGEGFDNAAETLFLSPLLTEKYLDAATFAMDFAAKEYKSRAKLLIAKPGPGVTSEKAAQIVLSSFLARAFRRPVVAADVTPYLDLFRTVQRQGHTFEESIFATMRVALVSPLFLFRSEPPNHTGRERPLDAYSLASRLSYFIWGSMPDELLTDVAASGKLNDPEVLSQLTERMLRNDRSLVFAERFTGQWLRTRELSGDKAPDAKLFPTYADSEELRADIRLQPVLFFREMLVRNRSVLDLLDSTHTVATGTLEKHLGLKLPLNKNARQQPQWVELPAGSNRGGLLGMPAVLAVSSYPYRTSPVLRGAWILETILGTPPPPPPPQVPALEEPPAGAPAKTMRERLAQHRANPACASCHSRIDGLGFALENYNVLGQWRDTDAGKPIDNSGELADGTHFRGPGELRAALLARKDLFVHNLTAKLLGYALGRSLTAQDGCTVDAIADRVREKGYGSKSLIQEIVLSVPFRYQAAAKSSGKGEKL